MQRPRSLDILGFSLLLALGPLPFLEPPAGSAAHRTAQDEVFGRLAAHIQAQIQADKRGFLAAQICTEWFYKQRFQKPPRPQAEGVGFHRTRPAGDDSDCPARYPGGLEAAREDFSRTQSLLSLSLTFYEFALVADRNDDQQYGPAELRDLLESVGLPFNTVEAAAAHLAALAATFDEMHRSGGLESLMTGMSALYERGYRLTGKDRAALDRVMG
jgi:hypothetical protein